MPWIFLIILVVISAEVVVPYMVVEAHDPQRQTGIRSLGEHLIVYTDPETCVEYLSTRISGKSLTPRLDLNGSVMYSKKCNGEQP